MSSPPTTTGDFPSRRELLRAGALSWFGLTLPQLLAARQVRAAGSVESELPGFGQAKACILLFMWGGPAHQDTWDLKPKAPREIRGEFSPIPTVTPGIEICEHFPQLAQRTNRLSIVRSMTHDNVDHTTATHYLLTGQRPPPPGRDLRGDWPSLGSVLSKLGRGAHPLPPFVTMRPKTELDVPRFVEQSHGQTAGWLGPKYDPLIIDADPNRQNYSVGDFELSADVSVPRLNERQSLLANLDLRERMLDQLPLADSMTVHYRRAFDLLHSAAGKSAFDLTREPDQVRDRYGRNPHGQSVLQARRLIEHGVPLVTVFWPNDGTKNVSVYWDTHSRNFTDLKGRLMPPADQAFSALLDDLQDRRMLDETLVIWSGEFGRTPKVGQRNSNAGAGRDGRDHWPGCFCSVLAGGGIKGGTVYGSSDPQAAYPASKPTHPVDLMATAHHLLGIPRDLTFHDHQGRPLVVCPGEPIHELIERV